MSVLYIQIRRNQITVRDLESKREVSGDAAFSNQRLLIANFFVAEKVLQDLVLQLHHVQPGILFASKTYGYCCERAGNE